MTYNARGETGFSEAERQAIVEEFLPRIKAWVMRMKGTLPGSVDVDDLYSSACLGLIESMDRFDKSRNVNFNTFAERRIKGAILDTLRNLDFLPRNVRTQLKQLDAQIEEISRKLGHKPTTAEVIEHTGMDEAEVYRLLGLRENDYMLSLDETVGDDGGNLIDFIKGAGLSPEDEVTKAQLTDKLAEEIDSLPEKERLVVTLYYYEELTMKEVAEVLGITESRVSQIHSAATAKLKKRLKGFYE